MRLSDPKPGETLGFDIDDGTGLRVARARFESESRFSWSFFDGYDRIRILCWQPAKLGHSETREISGRIEVS